MKEQKEKEEGLVQRCEDDLRECRDERMDLENEERMMEREISRIGEESRELAIGIRNGEREI